MPIAKANSKINPRRFAALLAGFDTGNGSEEEALAKGRAMRRMAADAGMRIVDVMELPDVKEAIDDQLGPARSNRTDLLEAANEAAALQEELTLRMRDVRTLAERLRQEEEKTEELSRELADARWAAGTVWSPARAPQPSPAKRSSVAKPSRAQFDKFWIEVGLPVATVIGGLIYGVVLHFTIVLGGNSNGLGNGQGKPVGGIYETGPIPALRAPAAVRHRVHRGGPASGTR